MIPRSLPAITRPRTPSVPLKAPTRRKSSLSTTRLPTVALCTLLGLLTFLPAHAFVFQGSSPVLRPPLRHARPSVVMMSGRDIIPVKGLPRSNIMQTNSSALLAFEAFDMGYSVEQSFEEVEQKEKEDSYLSLTASPASIISAAALIAGCMIGAGILALPSVTIHAGAMPSTLAIISVWMYCVASGLLIGEVCINSKGAVEAASYLKIAGSTVGKEGGQIAFGLFSVFQYILLMAYMGKGGDLLSGLLHTGTTSSLLDGASSTTVFTAIVGTILVACNNRSLQTVNNGIVAVVFASFMALLTYGVQHLDPSLLTHADPGYLRGVVPVAVCALVFQNVVPVISAQLEFNRRKIMWSIFMGTGIPLFMYLTWNAVVLGNTALSEVGPHGIDLPGMFGNGGQFGVIYHLFSLAAISTSFIGCSLSMLEEFSEFLRNIRRPVEGEDTNDEKLPLYLLILMPPLIASLFSDGGGLIAAVGNSGGYGDPLLFGLLPVIMAWKQRYQAPESGFVSETDLAETRVKPLLPGGKPVLATLVLLTVAMLINKAAPSSIPMMGGHF